MEGTEGKMITQTGFIKTFQSHLLPKHNKVRNKWKFRHVPEIEVTWGRLDAGIRGLIKPRRVFLKLGKQSAPQCEETQNRKSIK